MNAAGLVQYITYKSAYFVRDVSDSDGRCTKRLDWIRFEAK